MDYKVTDIELSSIADAIRTKGDTSEPLVFPSGFVSAITSIPVPSGSINISQNGTYDVSAFADAVVSVSGGGGGSNDNFKIAMGVMSGSIYDTEVSSVRAYAFYVQTSGNTKVLGATMLSAETIGYGAFAYCYSLSTVDFPVCETIDNYAFERCGISIASFSKCTSLGSSAFYECASLKTADFSVCTAVPIGAFADCYELETLNFPMCTQVYSNAFVRCSSLSDVNLPACVSIASAAFPSCVGLKSVNLPVCTRLSNTAFQYCSALENISLPMCAYIGVSVFLHCSALRSISLPMCSIISTNAFSNCRALESVYMLSTSVATLGTTVFSYTPIDNSSYLGYFGSIYVPSSLVDAYKSATRWSAYSDRITAYVE